MHRLCGAALGGLALSLEPCVPPVTAQDFAGLDLIWVRPASEPDAPPGCARLLLLNLPRDWVAGDAAAIVFVGGPGGPASAASVVLELVARGAAVLELATHRVEGCARPPAALEAEVLGAVDSLRTEAGAGIVVALGLGRGGEAVLAAAREEVAARHLGPGGARLTAAVALGPAGPAVRAGPAPPEAEHWPARMPSFCEAMGALAGPEGERACFSALAPGGAPVAGLASPRH